MKDLVELIQPLDTIQLNLLKQSKLYLACKRWFIPKEG